MKLNNIQKHLLIAPTLFIAVSAFASESILITGTMDGYGKLETTLLINDASMENGVILDNDKTKVENKDLITIDNIDKIINHGIKPSNNRLNTNDLWRGRY